MLRGQFYKLLNEYTYLFRLSLSIKWYCVIIIIIIIITLFQVDEIKIQMLFK